METLIKIQKQLNLLTQSVGSLIKIAVMSKSTNLSEINKDNGELIILGNGPSLRKLLDENRTFTENKDLMVVNFSSKSEDYTTLHPKYYLLMDPAFFENAEIVKKVFDPMVEKTSWPMTLFVPSTSCKYKEWQDIVSRNRNITIKFFNPTPIEGYKSFCHFCYKKGWGMPRPRNVLVACCMVSLAMPYNRIYLAGADHSWMKEIWVDDNNVVQEDCAHFYNKKGTTRITSHKKLYMLVESMAIAFHSYLYVEEYSKTLGKKIINISEGSYIDAFERMKV